MDKLVIQKYRQLLREGFAYAGKLENPDVFIDSIGEKIQVCGSIGRAYMHIYIFIKDGIIEKIRYLCTCDPVANVVIEILCSLAEGKHYTEVMKLTPEDFSRVLGSESEEFLKRAAATIELVSRGLQRYDHSLTQSQPSAQNH